MDYRMKRRLYQLRLRSSLLICYQRPAFRRLKQPVLYLPNGFHRYSDSDRDAAIMVMPTPLSLLTSYLSPLTPHRSPTLLLLTPPPSSRTPHPSPITPQPSALTLSPHPSPEHQTLCNSNAVMFLYLP